MSPIRFAALASISILSAAPAAAQLGYWRELIPTSDVSTTSFQARLAAYRQLVAKKTSEDGGTLSTGDRTMLHKRLHRLIVEEDERENPFWPDAMKSSRPHPAYPSR